MLYYYYRICLTFSCKINALKFYVFNINYRSATFLGDFFYAFKIFLAVVFLEDSRQFH